MVGIGLFAVGGRHENMARHLLHCGQHRLVPDAAGLDLSFHHLGAQGLPIHAQGRSGGQAQAKGNRKRRYFHHNLPACENPYLFVSIRRSR